MKENGIDILIIEMEEVSKSGQMVQCMKVGGQMILHAAMVDLYKLKVACMKVIGL